MRDETICPVCWHREEMEARINGHDPCHDDAATMRFRTFHGPRGQVSMQHEAGYWLCEVCGMHGTPEQVGILLDAVMMLSEPNCDSIRSNGLHADTMTALRMKEAKPWIGA